MDGSHHSILLEVVELIPNDGALEVLPGGQGILRSFIHEVTEDVIESKEVNEFWRVLAIERLHLRQNLIRHVFYQLRIVPDAFEHCLKASCFLSGLEVTHACNHTRPALVPQTLKREGICLGAHEALVLALRVPHMIGS